MIALAFLVGLGMDFGWACYTLCLTEGESVPASLWSMYLGCLGLLTITFVATSLLASAGYIAGLGFGTYAASRFSSPS